MIRYARAALLLVALVALAGCSPRVDNVSGHGYGLWGGVVDECMYPSADAVARERCLFGR